MVHVRKLTEARTPKQPKQLDAVPLGYASNSLSPRAIWLRTISHATPVDASFAGGGG